MRVVVGLGNPGTKYNLTRHNVGFLILDRLAEKYSLEFKPSKKDYYYSEGLLDSSDFFLVKPTTYMNLSGEAVLDFTDLHPVNVEDILVLVDDVNLLPGQIRLRKSGSDGGHNGIKSIIYHLQSDSFPRLRFGIGNEFEKGEMANFVLARFNKNELKDLEKSLDLSVKLIEKFICGGYKSMLDFFSINSKKEKEEEKNRKSESTDSDMK